MTGIPLRFRKTDKVNPTLQQDPDHCLQTLPPVCNARLQFTKLLWLVCLVFAAVGQAYAKAKTGDLVQREASLFDNQENTVSNIQFFTSNYGIWGMNVAANLSGTFWPRNSDNAYLFGGGIWFGTTKLVGGAQTRSKLVFLSYNPDSGLGWAVPGRMEDGESLSSSPESIQKYRVYYSTDFDRNGQPLLSEDGPGWPLWNTIGQGPSSQGRFAGTYIHEVEQRSRVSHPLGIATVSDEDIISTFKGSDLSVYEGNPGLRRQQGYPLDLQFEQAIYSWATAPLNDAIIVRYRVTNETQDTLFDCWLSPVFDFDIRNIASEADGAGNDDLRYYEEDPELELVMQWTEGDRGEAGRGFGYVGLAILESPAVDQDRFLRSDKQRFTPEEQLGLTTFRNWSFGDDPESDEDRYDYMAAGVIDAQSEVGDKRFLLSTGPFNLRPGESASIVYTMAMAAPATAEGQATAPTGTSEDAAGIVALVKEVRRYYNNQFTTDVSIDPQNPEALELALFPNPLAEQGSLRIRSASAGMARMEVIGLLGQSVVPIQQIQLRPGFTTMALDVAALPAGSYFCRVSTHESSVMTAFAIVK